MMVTMRQNRLLGKLTILCLILMLIAFMGCHDLQQKQGITFDYYIRANRKEYIKVESLYNSDIAVINWDKQIFKINDEIKVKKIDSIIESYGGFRSYFSVYYNSRFLYNVSVVPKMVSSEFCSSCPRVFTDKKNKLFDENSQIVFYFGLNTESKYHHIKDSLQKIIR